MVIASAAFFAMEPVTAATHRFVMHGPGRRLHRSHHLPQGGLEANDAFPVMFAAVVCAALWVGFNAPGWADLVPLGAGITAYGLTYAVVHDIYIHRRVRRLRMPRLSILERLAAAHRIHHQTSGPPYGMLLPVVSRRSPASGSRPSHVPADA